MSSCEFLLKEASTRKQSSQRPKRITRTIRRLNVIAKKPATFCNPFWPENFPDPFVLKVRGRYYAYGSEYGMLPPPASNSKVFPVLASTDLVHWSSVGKAMPALGDPYFGYWAPEVIVHNSQFLLYYAVH